MAVPLSFALILGLLGQTATTGGAHDTPAARLEFMKASLKSTPSTRLSDPETIYKLESEPVMRFTNPVGTVKDGAIFFWTGAGDRPEAAVQIFLHNNGTWYQEFSSLSTGPLSAGQPWRRGAGRCRAQSHPGRTEARRDRRATASPDPRPDRRVFRRRAIREENLAKTPDSHQTVCPLWQARHARHRRRPARLRADNRSRGLPDDRGAGWKRTDPNGNMPSRRFDRPHQGPLEEKRGLEPTLPGSLDR